MVLRDDARQRALDAIRGVLTSGPDDRRDSRSVVRGACDLVPKLTTTDALSESRVLAFPAPLSGVSTLGPPARAMRDERAGRGRRGRDHEDSDPAVWQCLGLHGRPRRFGHNFLAKPRSPHRPPERDRRFSHEGSVRDRDVQHPTHDGHAQAQDDVAQDLHDALRDTGRERESHALRGRRLRSRNARLERSGRGLPDEPHLVARVPALKLVLHSSFDRVSVDPAVVEVEVLSRVKHVRGRHAALELLPDAAPRGQYEQHGARDAASSSHRPAVGRCRSFFWQTRAR